MCAPAIIATVREEWSRRRVLGTLGAATVAPSIAPAAIEAQRAVPTAGLPLPDRPPSD